MSVLATASIRLDGPVSYRRVGGRTYEHGKVYEISDEAEVARLEATPEFEVQRRLPAPSEPHVAPPPPPVIVLVPEELPVLEPPAPAPSALPAVEPPPELPKLAPKAIHRAVRRGASPSGRA